MHPPRIGHYRSTSQAPPKRDTFLKLQIYERLWISLVEVYKRVGKSAFPSVCKKDFKKAKRRIYDGKKVKKISQGFVMECSKLGVPLLNGRYKKGVMYLYCRSKIVDKRVTLHWISGRSLPM